MPRGPSDNAKSDYTEAGPVRASRGARYAMSTAWAATLIATGLIVWLATRPAIRGPMMRDMQSRLQTRQDVDTSYATPETEEEDRFTELRRAMVDVQLRSRGIDQENVLEAMRHVPRHRFVPAWLRDSAYTDQPLPIGLSQTISQPYIVALMTQLARATSSSRALDVGTGSGYQAAILAEICQQVYSIEIVPELGEQARERLNASSYENIQVRIGDGYRGWPEQAPFDVIIVAAAPDHIPQPLVDQLAPGGRLVLPVGDRWQELVVIEKLADGSTRQRIVTAVAFVPMTGEAQTGEK